MTSNGNVSAGADYPQECLHALFRKQARATPDAVAVVTGGVFPTTAASAADNDNNNLDGITYAQLDAATDRLASMLLKSGVTKNSTVGILMQRRPEYALAYIAILKAGAGYGVLDPAYPDALLGDVLKTASPKVVVTTRRHVGRLPESQRAITLRSNWNDCLDELTPEDEEALKKVEEDDLDSLAYVVFSSGTTGQPKGIACPHRGAVFSYHRRFVDVPYDNFPSNSNDDDGGQPKQEVEAANVFFVWEMLRPLLKGQRLAVIPDDTIYDPLKLTSYLSNVGATRMLFTPSLLEAVLDCRSIPGEELRRRLDTMKVIVLCGEVVTTSLHARIRSSLPHVKIWNLYSVSECHDVCHADLTGVDYTAPNYSGRKYCPVGKLFPGVEAHVLDEELRPLALGEEGQLFVAGPTLALRYVNMPRMTAERFPIIDGKRMYKTGDRAKVLPNRELEILGRCDSMVKVRGYSVELRAIEVAIMSLPGGPVRSCVVSAQGEEGQDKFVVAYVVLTGGGDGDGKEGISKSTCRDVRMALKSQLPHYMIPSYFVQLDELPTHEVSGKLDKKALPKVDLRTGKAEGLEEKNGGADGAVDIGTVSTKMSDCTPPRNDVEETLHEIWCNVLGMAKIDVVYDSFFDCGGHSLLAAKLVQEISASDKFSFPKKRDVNVGVIDLFHHSTIEALGKFLTGENEAETEMEHTLDLDAEVELFDTHKAFDDISMRVFWRNIRFKTRTRSALMTGGTGYLGSFLLYELLVTMDVDVVYCIVRQSRDESVTSLDRVKSALAQRGLWRDGFEERIHALTGDASLHHLGLDDDDFVALSNSVDLAVHCAAVVNLVYPYNGLRSANVLGTANMIDFAVRGKVKRFGYISTNGVFPANGLADCKESADLAPLSGDLKSGYSQSKWVAERLVQLAVGRGLPAVVFRPGNLGGDSGGRGGNQSWNASDLNYLVLTGCVNLGAAPLVDDWMMEMTPVDIAAHGIVRILQSNETLGKTYHVTNCQNCLTAGDYFDAIRSRGHVLERLSWKEWRARLAESDNPSLVKLKGALVDTAEEDVKNLSTFDNESFVQECSALGITLPKITDATMHHYVDLWQTEGVIPPPPQIGSCPLRGKVVIITGASSGIGAAIAEALAGAGASVAIGGRRLDRLKDLANAIAAKTGSRVHPHRVDVTARSQVKEFVEKSEAALGPCDVFVNNAGVMHYTRLERGFEDLWEKEVDVNCKGLLHGIGAVLPGMIARGRGHILATSSDAGRKAFPGLSVYSGTKFFVEATCQGLRLETADKGIKVTTIQPGDCRTELSSVVKDAESHAEFAQSSNDRSVWLDPQDVAEAVLYAVSAPAHVGVNEVLIEPRGAPA